MVIWGGKRRESERGKGGREREGGRKREGGREGGRGDRQRQRERVRERIKYMYIHVQYTSICTGMLKFNIFFNIDFIVQHKYMPDCRFRGTWYYSCISKKSLNKMMVS